GKTTLFRIISGEELLDSGGIVKSSGISVGVLQQHACADSRKSCYDEALSVFGSLIAAEEELARLHRILETSTDHALIEKANALQEKFQADGGLTFRSKTRAALMGLGFTEAELTLTVDKLSGGQRSKIEICKLLLSSPDIMLLDEPTNHLDIDAIQWLDGFIKQSRSAVMIISHDRYFLDRVCDKILSIEHKKLYTYPGNYTKYLELRQHREETVEREYANTMREVRRIEGIIEQQRRWNREKNIKTAESKQKQIDRMLRDLQIPESEAENMTLRFTAGNICSENVLSVKNAACQFDNKILYRDVSFDVRRGDRIIMLGKNGCGKTTLIKAITDGFGQRGIGVKVGYFDQHGRTLKDSNTIFGQLREDFPSKGDTELRCALALFLFKGDDVFKEISSLSGGEKARVALCSLMLRKDNFLILDEPTNHLDLASREILENALEEFEGTILAVSHDRWFINKIARRIFYFENQNLFELNGNYDDYLALKQSREEAENTPKKTIGTGGAAYKQQKAEAARQRKLKTQLENTEKEIEALEERQGEIEGLLCDPETASDYELMMKLSNELEEVKDKLSAAMELWEELSLEIC
ncbi:MAG: ATP-binding cassette domain-containing protein, partial [Acutalibacteraceae bacterium]|nr:ATP-binding cassette domain-containing protein [Acutalibacteraceae bacterium]